MSFQDHVADIGKRHRDIEKQIEAERSRPSRNQFRLGELKRRKLLLKDELARLQP